MHILRHGAIIRSRITVVQTRALRSSKHSIRLAAAFWFLWVSKHVVSIGRTEVIVIVLFLELPVANLGFRQHGFLFTYASLALYNWEWRLLRNRFFTLTEALVTRNLVVSLDAFILKHAIVIISTVGCVLSPAHDARLCSSVGRVVDDISHYSFILGLQIVIVFTMARLCLNTLFRRLVWPVLIIPALMLISYLWRYRIVFILPDFVWVAHLGLTGRSSRTWSKLVCRCPGISGLFGLVDLVRGGGCRLRLHLFIFSTSLVTERI